ncbi:Protein kinase, catalytic domain-containing protein [Cynara cardunculus var. scolymus]|uniref:Protein kinase, catalytic domain-containing protein n=1 Tax=Cynara cardunculus var. scolymus TaxID=59895 RepID=A0A103Y997_CYNCS|nr:Protein kinase, catalytic domain-containing protein [Cynara cardunculus var. scolymus]
MEPLSDIEQVLHFFRKNGLSDAESALMDDIFEKSQLGSFDFQRFLFPILPQTLHSLKIPAARLISPPPSPPRQMTEEVEGSSDDEFVSLGSSTTDLCSSEFTNPYGIRTTRGVSSQASSDRLSQFGTARDYHEFDLQNDLNWYRERDEDYAMPPSFDNSDPFSGPTEDKFVMTAEKENQDENRQPFFDPILDPFEQTIYLDKPWPLTSIGYVKDGVKVTDYYDLDGKCVEQDLNGGDADATNDELLMYANEDEYEVFELRIIHRKNRTGFEENKDLPIVLNSVIGSRYCVTEYLGSAAFSKVVQAHDLQMGTDVCLKIIKNDKDFFDQSLDEIKLLKFPENILIKSYSRCEIKIIDLGSSCFQNDNLSLYVQSRSYRAPEVIIGLPYDQKIDLWSLGCILAELYSVVILLARVIGMLGPIDTEMLESGQETDKYFTKDFDLYHINEVNIVDQWQDRQGAKE